MSGYDIIKKNCYLRTWNHLCKDITENGLSSKTLGKETVVCTAQLLMLAAMEKERLSDSEISFFNRIAQKLWETRNDEFGWGIYVSISDNEYCSYANTAWALRALFEYSSIRDSVEYHSFCNQIFESERDGKFSFFNGGQSKLMVTAMYLGLYYKLVEKWKDEQIYLDKKEAINFIYKCFVEQNIQIEIETLFGVSSNRFGAQKEPWNHITVWPVLDALKKAYNNGDLKEEQWKRLISHINLILKNNVRSFGNMIYYHPDGMDESRLDHYTYPTSYLIMGLSQL